MAEADSRLRDENLGAAFEQVKRDGAAWIAAEHQLLRARVKDGVRRLVLAALLAGGALMASIAAIMTFANMLVDLLTPALGAVLAGLVVTIVLFIVGALLIFWVKSLLRPQELGGRTLDSVKVLWNSFHEQN
jgi:hypothetical protein